MIIAPNLVCLTERTVVMRVAGNPSDGYDVIGSAVGEALEGYGRVAPPAVHFVGLDRCKYAGGEVCTVTARFSGPIAPSTALLKDIASGSIANVLAEAPANLSKKQLLENFRQAHDFHKDYVAASVYLFCGPDGVYRPGRPSVRWGRATVEYSFRKIESLSDITCGAVAMADVVLSFGSSSELDSCLNALLCHSGDASAMRALLKKRIAYHFTVGNDVFSPHRTYAFELKMMAGQLRVVALTVSPAKYDADLPLFVYGLSVTDLSEAFGMLEGSAYRIECVLPDNFDGDEDPFAAAAALGADLSTLETSARQAVSMSNGASLLNTVCPIKLIPANDNH